MVVLLSTNKEQRQVHLFWAITNKQQPCFCHPVIHFDIVKLNPSPETIAAIFGVWKPETILIYEKGNNGKVVPLNEDRDSTWPLEPLKDYEVRVSDDACDENADNNDNISLVPINQIFALFPGNTDDEKGKRILNLSENFYHKLWKDNDTPQELRETFYSRFSSYQMQAYRQYDWFHEVFGGPSIVPDNDKREQYLLPKVMAKHTPSRMTKQNAVSWLQIMKKSLDEEFPNERKLKSTLARYWLHFYGFFPFSDDDRREFRRVCMCQ